MKKNIFLLLTLLVSATSLYATKINDFMDLRNCDQLINKKIYKICYSYRYKGALGGWTRLDGNKVNAVNIKKRPRFYEDTTIPRKYRTHYYDYTGMGRIWNRGHFIVADADADYSHKSLYLVYDMAQIEPQSAKLNQKTWLKVERYGRYMATILGYVNSISIADYKNANKTIKNNVVIPTGFYRIYYNDKAHFKKCFYYKNIVNVDVRHDKLKNHLVNCSAIKQNWKKEYSHIRVRYNRY